MLVVGQQAKPKNDCGNCGLVEIYIWAQNKTTNECDITFGKFVYAQFNSRKISTAQLAMYFVEAHPPAQGRFLLPLLIMV